MASGGRVSIFGALLECVLRALVARPPDLDYQMAEDNHQGARDSWSEPPDHEYGVPPSRFGGWQ